MKVVISGYGKMGRMVEKILSGRGIECAGKSEDIQGFDKALAKDCVCIDFTVPSAFKANYRFLAENFKAVVVGTTGWGDIRDEVIAYFGQCGTPMIYASNFSVGVNVLFRDMKHYSLLRIVWELRPMSRPYAAGRFPGYIQSDSRGLSTGLLSGMRHFPGKASPPGPWMQP